MKFTTLILSATLASAVGFSGCTHDNSRSDYPDRTEETKSQAQAIRDDGQRQKDAIARELDQSLVALAFRTSQTERKAKQEREQISIDLDQSVQPLKAKQDDAKAACERECLRIDEAAAGPLANAKGEEAYRIKVNVDSSKATCISKASEIHSENESKIIEVKNKSAKRLANVAEGEASEMSVIAKERADAERLARERTLAVSVETTKNIDNLGERSASRRDAISKQETESETENQRIISAVRKEIDQYGQTARDVTVTAVGGAVSLSGSVPSTNIKNEIVSRAGKISGVTNVDDNLVVR